MRPTLTGESITKKVMNTTTGQMSDFNPAAFQQTGTYAFGNAPRFLSNVRFPSFTALVAAGMSFLFPARLLGRRQNGGTL